MAAPDFKHGKDGRVIVGATTLYAEEWSFEPSGDLEEVSNFEGSGFKEKIPGLKDGSGTIRMTWDAANPPLTDPPNLNVHSQVALKLYIDKGAGAYWNIPKAFITSTPMVVPAGAKISFEASFETSGTFNMAGV